MILSVADAEFPPRVLIITCDKIKAGLASGTSEGLALGSCEFSVVVSVENPREALF